MQEERCCHTCLFWRVAYQDYQLKPSDCKAHPPVVVTVGEHGETTAPYSMWPQTGPYECCGEWTPKGR